MIYYLTTLKDIVGNNYIGIRIDNMLVDPFLKKLNDILDPDDYLKYTKLQQQRDHGSYHITVINVMDYNRLSKEMGVDKFVNSLEIILKYPIDDLQMLGIGTANRSTNTAYFIVCRSEKLKSIRDRFNLENQDFHITLGFFSKDVFGVRKNEVMDIKSKFLHVLKQEFYKKENFNFVKDISNFEESRDFDVIPISISDEHLKVLCGDVIMDVGYLESENKLFIFTKYKKSSEVSRLPMTEILRILKINN
jgi:hypothetical protein